jgi:hypothetical protein
MSASQLGRTTTGWAGTIRCRSAAGWLAAVALSAAPLFPRPAWADDRARGDAVAGDAAPQAKRARGVCAQGAAALEASDYEAARRALDECHRLTRDPKLLRDLGLSELRGGHHVAAARHFAELATTGGDDIEPAMHAEARKLLVQAEAFVGKLIVEVDLDGSSVHVDGESVGPSPLRAPVYVEPGDHEVRIELAGYPEVSRRASMGAGEAAVVSVSLDELRRAQDAEGALGLMGTDRGEEAPSDRFNPATAYGTLGAATAVLLVGGLYFTVSASDNESEAEALTRALSAGAGSTSTCGDGTPFSLECDRLHRAQRDGHSDRQWASGAFIAAGAAGTVALGFLLWDLLSDNEQVLPPGVTADVSIAPHTAAIELSTRF